MKAVKISENNFGVRVNGQITARNYPTMAAAQEAVEKLKSVLNEVSLLNQEGTDETEAEYLARMQAKHGF